MKTPILILSLFAFMPLVNWSQTTLSVSETHRLFRGYDNKITLGSQVKQQDIEVVSNDVDLIKKEAFYIARPTVSSKTARIFVLSSKNKDTIATYHFTVANLPKAIVTIDGDETNKTISEKNKAFVVQLPSEFPIESPFEVIKAEVMIQGAPRPIQFDGATFSEEFKNILHNAKNETIVSVFLIVKDAQGIRRKSTETFTVLHE